MNSILRTSRVKSALSAVVCDSSGSGTVSVDGVTITGDGSVGNPLVATAGAAGLQAANNLSDVASAVTSRANLDAAHDRITVTDKSTGFAPRLTDFEGASLKTNPLFRCTASFTVTLDQDSTDSIPVGFTIFGMTMSGYTTTFGAGSGATMETSSGGATVVASATEQFVLWSATKRAANVWSVQNGRAASVSPNLFVKTRYNHLLENATNLTTAAMTANLLRAYCLPIRESMTLSAGLIEVTTGTSGNIRIGIYSSDSNGGPSALLYDSGAIVVTAPGVYALTINLSLTPGLYWVASLTDTANTVRVLAGASTISLGFAVAWGASTHGLSITVAQTYGALPNPYTAGYTYLTSMPTPVCIWTLG